MPSGETYLPPKETDKDDNRQSTPQLLVKIIFAWTFEEFSLNEVLIQSQYVRISVWKNIVFFFQH